MFGLGRRDAGVELAHIYRELGVPLAIVASARARAFCKASNLRTYYILCDLVGSPFRSRHMTWTSGTISRRLGKWIRWPQVKAIGAISSWEVPTN